MKNNKKVYHNAKKVVFSGSKNHTSSFSNLSVSYRKKVCTLRQNNRALAQELSQARRRIQLGDDRIVSLQRALNLQVPKVVSKNLNKMVGQLKSFLDTMEQTIHFLGNPETMEIDSTILNPDIDMSMTPQQRQMDLTSGQGDIAESRYPTRRANGLQNLLTLTPIDEQSFMDTTEPQNGPEDPQNHRRRSSTHNDTNVTRRTKSKSRSTTRPDDDDDIIEPLCEDVPRTPSPEVQEVPQEFDCFVSLDRLPSFLVPFSTPRLGILKARNPSLFNESPSFPSASREPATGPLNSDINGDEDDVTVKIPVDMELTMIRDNSDSNIEVTVPKKGKVVRKAGATSKTIPTKNVLGTVGNSKSGFMRNASGKFDSISREAGRTSEAPDVETSVDPQAKESEKQVTKKVVAKANGNRNASRKLSARNANVSVEPAAKHSDTLAVHNDKSQASTRTVQSSHPKRVSFSNSMDVFNANNGVRTIVSSADKVTNTEYMTNETSGKGSTIVNTISCSVVLQNNIDIPNFTNKGNNTHEDIFASLNRTDQAGSRSPIRRPDCPRMPSSRIAAIQLIQSPEKSTSSTSYRRPDCPRMPSFRIAAIQSPEKSKSDTSSPAKPGMPSTKITAAQNSQSPERSTKETSSPTKPGMPSINLSQSLEIHSEETDMPAKPASPFTRRPDAPRSPSARIASGYGKEHVNQQNGTLETNNKNISQVKSTLGNTSETPISPPQLSTSVVETSKTTPEIAVRRLNFNDPNEACDLNKQTGEVPKSPLKEIDNSGKRNNEDKHDEKRTKSVEPPDMAKPSGSGLKNTRRIRKPARKLSDSSSSEEDKDNDNIDHDSDIDFIPNGKNKPGLKTKRGPENFRFFSANHGKKTNRSSKHLIKRTRVPLKNTDAKKTSPKSVFDPSFNETPPVLRDIMSKKQNNATEEPISNDTEEPLSSAMVSTAKTLETGANVSASPAGREHSKAMSAPVSETKPSRRKPKANEAKGNNSQVPKRKYFTVASNHLSDKETSDNEVDLKVSTKAKKRKNAATETAKAKHSNENDIETSDEELDGKADNKVKKMKVATDEAGKKVNGPHKNKPGSEKKAVQEKAVKPKKKVERAKIHAKKGKENGTLKNAKKKPQDDADNAEKQKSPQYQSPMLQRVVVKIEPLTPAMESCNSSAGSPATPKGVTIKTRVSSVTKRNVTQSAKSSPNLKHGVKEQNNCAMNGTGQSRRSRKTVGNYKEPSLNVKMRRP